MPESSWWSRYNDGVRRLQEAGWADASVALSDDILALLNDVDAECARTGASPAAWQDVPLAARGQHGATHDGDSVPVGEGPAVERVLAWLRVLLGRGWARPNGIPRWALPPFQSDGQSVALIPGADGAVPLVLMVHPPLTTRRPYTVSVAAGEPAVRLATFPESAGADRDDETAEMLSELDQWVLSVIDGSLQVALTADSYSVRTSFGGESITPVQGLIEQASFVAAPWPPRWRARSLVTKS
ncbi:DUF6226 family protein [Skermania sp. ID1734]|uniref:DUF6226 family protein n=1 Tax=Skermania sp. ID1734 TaxID=2597516 RepID=UPI001C8F2A10